MEFGVCLPSREHGFTARRLSGLSGMAHICLTAPETLTRALATEAVLEDSCANSNVSQALSTNPTNDFSLLVGVLMMQMTVFGVIPWGIPHKKLWWSPSVLGPSGTEPLSQEAASAFCLSGDKCQRFPFLKWGTFMVKHPLPCFSVVLGFSLYSSYLHDS